MKLYRIIYWLGSMRTEWITRAKTEEDAIKKFCHEKGEGFRIERVDRYEY